jgi:acetylornithine/LysW-gamma-L-lysine aminotransferase
MVGWRTHSATRWPGEEPGLTNRAGTEFAEMWPQDIASVIEMEDSHTSGAYPKRPLALVRGHGSQVRDAEGRTYIDMTSGQGVVLLGHTHPRLVEAIQRQAERLITCPEIFYNDQRALLGERLSRHTPHGMTRFFFCNSGTEAVEGALKLSRLMTQRKSIIAAQRGFHGRTMGALSATWNTRYREPFEPLIPEIRHIPYTDLPAAEKAIGDSTAAVLLEVIQGEGGVYPGSSEFLHGVRELCSDRGALLIIDEVQTGLGRTGTWFACQGVDVTPDVMCLGKGIAGGLPMGVVCWRERLGGFAEGMHGSTLGGNPLACAAALATLDILTDEDLPTRSRELGDRLLADLRAMDQPLIRDIRGRGLMIGIDLRKRVTPALKELMSRGVLALPAGPTVLRLLPPLVARQDELDFVRAAIAETLKEMQDA